MAGHGVKKASRAWLLRWVAFPTKSHREANCYPPAQNWARIAELFATIHEDGHAIQQSISGF